MHIYNWRYDMQMDRKIVTSISMEKTGSQPGATQNKLYVVKPQKYFKRPHLIEGC